MDRNAENRSIPIVDSALSADWIEDIRKISQDEKSRKKLAEILTECPEILNDIVDLIPNKSRLRSIIKNPGQFLPIEPRHRPPTAGGYEKLTVSGLGLKILIENYSFSTVLDVGAGAGNHAKILHKHGKTVTKIDFGTSVYAKKADTDDIRSIFADINKVELNEKFDCVWASHILEHQPNVGAFIQRLRSWTVENGIIAITVPPAKFPLVGGHLSLWTPGHLIYNLVINGIDCSDARLMHYGYNITAIVRNRTASLPTLHYDKGDINRLRPFMPSGFAENVDGFSVASNL